MRPVAADNSFWQAGGQMTPFGPLDWSLVSARRIGTNKFNAKSPVSSEMGDFFTVGNGYDRSAVHTIDNHRTPGETEPSPAPFRHCEPHRGVAISCTMYPIRLRQFTSYIRDFRCESAFQHIQPRRWRLPQPFWLRNDMVIDG